MTYKQRKQSQLLERTRKREGMPKLHFDEKRRKHVQPNRLSELATVEDELSQRNYSIEKSLEGYRVMLPRLLQKLSSIKDPRNPLKIKHQFTCLMVYGLLIFLLEIGSRRNANKELSMPILFENLRLCFPELSSMPHADTLSNLLERIDVEGIQDAHMSLLKQLIKKKKFKNYLINNKYIVAVDGTGKFSREQEWTSECLKKKNGKKQSDEDERAMTYSVYSLESVLILRNGLTIPLLSEILSNDYINEQDQKQDCELKAFYRLCNRLKQEFPKLSITLVLDALYACGPVFELCTKKNWGFMIVLKKDDLTSIWTEAQALAKLSTAKQNRQEAMWGNRNQAFEWNNEIEYWYANNKKCIQLHVAFCTERWGHPDNPEETHYAWISSTPLNSKNICIRCNYMGRYRWCIENNILTMKHQGYHYEHCYSYNWQAMKGYHYLMNIGRMMNVLALEQLWLHEFVQVHGIRFTLKLIRTTLKVHPLQKERLEYIHNEQYYWKLAG